ncbi:hypothetical protein KO566_05600 [Flavobacteriaceae bacterium XHP0103]|uniref:hypothetical protein n=1 Tax=Marixanthotalea marina TaxID=2844359 RepID=UPI002989F94B|nr:hypothetical protein [Marixanthotalea marina]MBU3821528.1 hypothetical protein [Marixanthotalea marina]
MEKKGALLFMFVFFTGVFALIAQSQTQGKTPLDKNSAFVALLLSYDKTKKENNKNLLENVKFSDVSSFSVRSAGGYFFKKYFAVGLGFDYTSDKENSENINTFGPNTLVEKQLQTFTLTPFIRNYISIGSKDRLFLFTQTGLEFGFGNGDESTVTGSSTTFTDIKKLNYGIAFTPGVILIVEKGFAFEVNVGVLGLRHSKETFTPTDTEETVITKTNFNFDINLLKLNLGISYYF